MFAIRLANPGKYHYYSGIWGVISVGIFASPHAMGVAYGAGGCGIIYSGHDGCTNAGDQLMAQLVFVVAIIGWVVATMSLLLFVTKLVLGQLPGFVQTDGHKTPLAYTAAQQMEEMQAVAAAAAEEAEDKSAEEMFQDAAAMVKQVELLQDWGEFPG